MTNKPTILFISSWYPNKIEPKSGNFVQQHALAIAQYCVVYVLHIVPDKKSTGINIEQKKKGSLHEFIVYYKKIKGNSLFQQLKKFKIRQKAYKDGYQTILNYCKPDIIHLNICYPAGIFALYLKKKEKIPYLLTEHWTAFLDSDPILFNKIERLFIKKIIQNASWICPVSENLKINMHKYGVNKNYSVIPNVVNTEIFYPLFNSTIKYEKFKILHLSNLKDEHKNISGILNVTKKLSELRDDFVMTIAGDGDIEKYKQKAQQLSIPKHIISFKGEKQPEEVAQLMRESDAFILFSNYENLPCVIAESLVMGRPVIATDVGGVSEMVNKSNGLLVKPRNETDLLDKCNKMLNNLDFYNQQQIAKNAKEKYSYEAVAKSYLEIYQKVIKN